MKKDDSWNMRHDDENVSGLVSSVCNTVMSARHKDLEELLQYDFYRKSFKELYEKPFNERLKMFESALAKFENDVYYDRLFAQWLEEGLPENLQDKEEGAFFENFLFLCASIGDKVNYLELVLMM